MAIGALFSDYAAALSGSLGRLSSASFGSMLAEEPYRALYEPVHGSASDFAGIGVADPADAVFNFSMIMEWTFECSAASGTVRAAVTQTRTLADGAMTAGLGDTVTTQQITDAAQANLNESPCGT